MHYKKVKVSLREGREGVRADCLASVVLSFGSRRHTGHRDYFDRMIQS